MTLSTQAAARGAALVHAVAIILVAVRTQELAGAVCAEQHDRGMVNTVEHRGLDGGVVNHVFEEDALTYLQGLVEAP